MIEEFGDEWGNKWMFHFRWAREVDQVGCSKRLAAGMMPGADDAQIEQAALTIRERMVPRVWFVGSNEVTAPQIEQSFKDMLVILDTHLADRPYLFGGRPAFGDFGMWGQIYNARRDHTPKEILRSTPNVEAWIDRMLEPQAFGDFEDWSSLAGTLSPLLADQVAGLFLPWSAANAAAIADGRDEFSVTLKGNTWTQKPQKYHARSLAKLKAKYLAVSSSDEIRTVLEGTGCLDVLASPG
jgi:hypothetical protein